MEQTEKQIYPCGNCHRKFVMNIDDRCEFCDILMTGDGQVQKFNVKINPMPHNLIAGVKANLEPMDEYQLRDLLGLNTIPGEKWDEVRDKGEYAIGVLEYKWSIVEEASERDELLKSEESKTKASVIKKAKGRKRVKTPSVVSGDGTVQ